MNFALNGKAVLEKKTCENCLRWRERTIDGQRMGNGGSGELKSLTNSEMSSFVRVVVVDCVEISSMADVFRS